jgi:hypothetical protein
MPRTRSTKWEKIQMTLENPRIRARELKEGIRAKKGA